MIDYSALERQLYRQFTLDGFRGRLSIWRQKDAKLLFSSLAQICRRTKANQERIILTNSNPNILKSGILFWS